jgi:hypothetical protein
MIDRRALIFSESKHLIPAGHDRRTNEASDPELGMETSGDGEIREDCVDVTSG